MNLNRSLALVLPFLLVTACSTLPSYEPGETCVTELFTVLDEHQGARRGRCIATGSGSVRVEIRKEDEHVVNESPWYSFRIVPKSAGTASITLRYFGADHRYVPKISNDGLHWIPLDEQFVIVSDNGRDAELLIPLGNKTVWVSAQELIMPAMYDLWIDNLSKDKAITLSDIGQSINGQPIRMLDTGTASDDVLLIVGRQHPPEVSGVFAFFSFAETLFGDSDLAAEFRRRFRIVAIPLLNPDGVVGGNWRHNLGSKDLNRDWGPFTQPETQAIATLLDTLDAGGASIRMFADFHSTNRNLLYTQNDDFPTDPPGFVPAWLTNSAARMQGYEFTNEAGPVSEQANSKNYMYKRYGIPTVTFEVGDETDRFATRHAAAVFAEELMKLLLCAQQQPEFAQCL